MYIELKINVHYFLGEMDKSRSVRRTSKTTGLERSSVLITSQRTTELRTDEVGSWRGGDGEGLPLGPGRGVRFWIFGSGDSVRMNQVR